MNPENIVGLLKSALGALVDDDKSRADELICNAIDGLRSGVVSAAPDLYAALQRLEAALSKVQDWSGTRVGDALDDADQAILKARSESQSGRVVTTVERQIREAYERDPAGMADAEAWVDKSMARSFRAKTLKRHALTKNFPIHVMCGRITINHGTEDWAAVDCRRCLMMLARRASPYASNLTPDQHRIIEWTGGSQ